MRISCQAIALLQTDGIRAVARNSLPGVYLLES
ncbi:hypothetical protein HBHAL_2751 [Halobacillus halophilus DSM 2266]|uniref:Uncharacterized protein n=1 Tax=Halobacillus halophilus (strain ATCC 35676 / DSM 2266 / JCM 20832 / KCTC 3685 / LMG 17431 / NBRC 102448 / NCIMB 2269) TaxID=866895 RepID=I0JLS9_HALH3|nr:hypothetical protein HBHAL_2751 [Halobacillus halophilus DSM 2266]